MNEPKIRIKGFKGEWKKKQIIDVAPLQRGFDLPNNLLKKGRYPVVYSNGIGFSHNSYKCKAPGIVTGRSGTIGKFTYITSGYYWPHNTTLWVTDFKGNYPLFINYLYQTLHFEDFMMGSGVPTLNRNTIHNQYIYLPETSEQRAIATYFRHLDELIETVEKKVTSLKQVKEASLQTMFPQEGQTAPKVRFKGFEGEWKTIKLSTIAKRVTRKNTNLETTLPITISSQDGIVAQTSFLNNVVASSNLRGYYLMKKGEFAYNKSYSNGYPFGSVKCLDKYDMGALSTLYIVFSIDDTVDHNYITYFFETSLWHEDIAMRAAEGARNHGLLNIGAEDFLDINIIVPKDIAEQHKIAFFFTNLDKEIGIQQHRLTLLKRIKSACLDEMFV